MERISSLNHQLTGNETAFTGLTMAPPDGILGVKTAYLADKVTKNYLQKIKKNIFYILPAHSL